jgi:hypothetical protein
LSDAKRTGGSRDISELKQRLGLKKGASQSGSVPAVRSNGASGGVVPPPGLNLPPPPGVTPAAPPPPPQPVIPNASEDPFGAMNAMAAVGTVQRAPEMIIVHDGRPVENVAASSSGTRLAIIIGPAFVALIIGLFMGRTSRAGTDFNDGIASAASIYESVHALKTGALNDLTKFENITATAQGKKASTHPNILPDPKLDKILNAAQAKLEVKTEKYAIARNITLDFDTAGEVLEFYGGLSELRAMITTHLQAASYDDVGYKAAKQAMGDASAKPEINGTLLTGIRYAVVLTGPSEKDHSAAVGAKLVELGPPVCGGKLATSGKCDEQVTGYGIRSEIGADWKPADPLDSMDHPAADKIVPFQPSGTLDGFVKGAWPNASENAYALRVQAIVDKAQSLIDLANKLEPHLETAKSQSPKFTFFM